jgi:hypothetical protein
MALPKRGLAVVCVQLVPSPEKNVSETDARQISRKLDRPDVAVRGEAAAVASILGDQPLLLL